MQIRHLAVMFALGPFAGGCANLEVTHVLTGPELAPKSEDEAMPVYFNEAPRSPYVEVGQIRVRARGENATLEEVVAAARDDARDIGADAIIVDLRRHYRSLPVRIGCGGGAHVDAERRLNARVTAVRFVAPGSADPEPAPHGPRAQAGRCGR